MKPDSFLYYIGCLSVHSWQTWNFSSLINPDLMSLRLCSTIWEQVTINSTLTPCWPLWQTLSNTRSFNSQNSSEKGAYLSWVHRRENGDRIRQRIDTKPRTWNTPFGNLESERFTCFMHSAQWSICVSDWSHSTLSMLHTYFINNIYTFDKKWFVFMLSFSVFPF